MVCSDCGQRNGLCETCLKELGAPVIFGEGDEQPCLASRTD